MLLDTEKFTALITAKDDQVIAEMKDWFRESAKSMSKEGYSKSEAYVNFWRILTQEIQGCVSVSSGMFGSASLALALLGLNSIITDLIAEEGD